MPHRTFARVLAAALLALAGTPLPAPAAEELQRFAEARLVPAPDNDGDSFFVQAGGRQLRVRLYFVDCAETTVGSKSDAVRVREQTRYFGLARLDRTLHFGRAAKSFTENALARPFTVHTAFASALGRSAGGRVYAFVTTADGDDLGALLVRNGLARTRGTGRAGPDGRSRDETTERLRDAEASAMLRRAGIWAESDPARLEELRAQQRLEDQQLEQLQDEAAAPPGPVDLNRAERAELEALPGIGPVLAGRIVEGRPYRTVEDLRRVKGVSPQLVDALRERVTVAAP